MPNTVIFHSECEVTAEFDSELEDGGAVSVRGRFNPPAGEGVWKDGAWPDREAAADAVEDAVRAHFGRGIGDRTRLVRIVLHGAPTTLGEGSLSRYGVPVMWKDDGRRG